MFKDILSVSLVLFSVIDIFGSLPVVVDIKNRAGNLQAIKTTLAAGLLMLLFLIIGDSILHQLGTDVNSFAIAGTGTLTTILSLKSEFSQSSIMAGIVINLVIAYGVLKSCGWIERRLGHGGLSVLRKVFGIVLLSIAVRILRTNLLEQIQILPGGTCHSRDFKRLLLRRWRFDFQQITNRACRVRGAQ
ncbi:MAG: MarC family protein [Pirellulales bacterium]